MKKRFVSLIMVILMVCSCYVAVTVSVSADTPADNTTGGFLDRIRNDFDLVFNDDFEGDTLDTTKWQYDGDGVFRNSEAQIYANGPDDGNVYMEDGCVVLKAEKEERTSSSRDTTKQYTSGEISTQGKGSWKYGYFEFRAKLPKGHQVFPAIWLMGYDYRTSTCDWPHSGEIDIMEALGGDSDSSPTGTWSTLHHSRYGQSGSGSHVAKGAGSFDNKADMTTEFHNYWIYWTDEIIMCGVDDGCFGVIDITTPELAQSFREYEHWILFDLAMGPYGNKINERPTDDWRFYIDYARVYQLENEDDYDNYKIIEAEDTITDNGSNKSWSQNSATHLFSGSSGVVTSKIEGLENGTYDVYASYMAKATGKNGVFDSYINGTSTGEQMDTLSSTGAERSEQGYIGRVTVKDDSTFELKLKKSSGQADSLNIDKYMLVKTDDTTGAIVSDKDNNANLLDLIEVASTDEFYSAFNSLHPGGTVRLTEDITLNTRYTFTNDVTIDLNGHTMDSGTLNSAFYASKSNIKIKFMNGKITANGKSGVLDNFILAANSWDQHYVTFEDVDVTIGAKTMSSFVKGSWSTTTFTLKNCTFDLTGSPNDGTTDLCILSKVSGWNAANTTLNNVVINGKQTSSPIRFARGSNNIAIKNCTFNNCKYVIDTSEAIAANEGNTKTSITFANSAFNNIGSFTSYEENTAFFLAKDHNTWYDGEGNQIDALTYDISGNVKIACEHSYSEATCTAPATCQYCSHENGESLGGHNPGAPVRVEPDCVNAGSITVSCTECGEVLSQEKLHITDHDYQWVETVDPTCAQAGYHLYQCSVCGTKQTRSYYGDGKIAKLAHTPDPSKDVVVEPTCKKGGYTEHYCTVCNQTYKTDRHASRHTLVKDEVVAPTQTENGYTVYACAVDGCSYTVTRDLVAAGTIVEVEGTVNELDESSKLIGRAYKEDDSIVMAMSGSGVEYGIYCQGDVQVKINNTKHTTATSYLGVMIDGDYDNRKLIQIDGGENDITVASNLKAGEHVISLWHPDEYSKSTYRLKSLKFTGKASSAPASAKYIIDFYGDSITVGQGNVPLGEDGSYSSYTSNALDTYAGVAGRLLDADINICAASGYGIAYGFNENTNPAGGIISKIYDYSSPNDGYNWDYSSYTPDIAVVSLGQNDLSHQENVGDVDYHQELKDKIKDLIEKIRANNKSIPIIWIGGLMNSSGSFSNSFINIRNSLSQVIEENGYKDVYFKIIAGDSSGGNYHPSADAHKSIGESLAKYIETLDLLNQDTKVNSSVIDSFDNSDSASSIYKALYGDSPVITDSPVENDGRNKVLRINNAGQYSGLEIKLSDIPENCIGFKFDMYIDSNATMGVVVKDVNGNNLYGNSTTLSGIKAGEWVTITDIIDCNASDISTIEIRANWSNPSGLYFDNISYLTLGSTVCEHVANTALDKVVPPTCIDQGYTEHICAICGETYIDTYTEITGIHTPDLSKDKVVAPNCTYEGYTEHYCTVCKQTYKDTFVDKVPDAHEIKTMQGKAATCTEKGLTDGKYCELCRSVFVGQQEIPALGHKEVTDKGYAATCTNEGLTDGTHCERCNTVISEQNTIPALGHKEVVDKGYAATCTKDGLSDGKHCDRCHEVLVKQNVIPALGHTKATDKAVAPTCTETGLTEGAHCSKCGEVLIKQNIVPALGHTIVVDKAVNATCTNAGLSKGERCLVCGEVLVKQELVPALGHKIISVGAKPATYFENGCTAYQKCRICNGIISTGTIIPQRKLSTPKFKYTGAKKKIKVNYKKVADATGFQVRFKIGKGKWKVKSYNVSKNATKTINNLKKGNYKVQIRAIIKQNGQTAYSSWTKAKTVKVK